MQDAIFILFAAIAVIGGILAVSLKKVFYNALGLGLSFLGVAGIYIFLEAEFLAAIQIIIYIGAISIAIVFAVMLSDPQQTPVESSKTRRIVSWILASLLFVVLANVLLHAPWPQANGTVESGIEGTKAIGKHLLTHFVLPFELVSLVLLVAIIGALVISRNKSNTSES